jgi:hypothetical protein
MARTPQRAQASSRTHLRIGARITVPERATSIRVVSARVGSDSNVRAGVRVTGVP